MDQHGYLLLKKKVLENIQPNKKLDFGFDIIPSLIKQGEHLIGIKFDENLLFPIDTPQLLRDSSEKLKKSENR